MILFATEDTDVTENLMIEDAVTSVVIGQYRL